MVVGICTPAALVSHNWIRMCGIARGYGSIDWDCPSCPYVHKQANEVYCGISLVPRPHPQGGKRVWRLGAVCLAWPALGARADTAVQKQTSDLIGQ